MICYELKLGLNTPRAQRILDLARETKALLHGEFTLASGKKSDHYFDGKMLTTSPEGAYQVAMAVYEELGKVRVDAVGGLALGAVPIATAVALVSYEKGNPIPAFIVKDQTKDHGTKKNIEGHLKDGDRVAIVDDVITTGGSVVKAIEAVKARGCQVVKVIVIVDRHEGGSDRLKKEGYDFAAIIDLWPSGETDA